MEGLKKLAKIAELRCLELEHYLKAANEIVAKGCYKRI